MGRLRQLFRAFAALLAFSGAGLSAQTIGSDTAYIYATQPGEPALDSDRFGGNPFASALIAALAEQGGDSEAILIADTIDNSGNFQVPDLAQMGGASIHPAEGQSAFALILVVADYGSDDGLVSLPGAAFDAARLLPAFTAAGYRTHVAVVRSAREYQESLAEFKRRAARFDVAALYTTGHGGEVDGEIRLLMPEYDVSGSRENATIPLSEVAEVMTGKTTNLLFYAGCRDNPFRVTEPGG